jgi:hypothetical protein
VIKNAHQRLVVGLRSFRPSTKLESRLSVTCLIRGGQRCITVSSKLSLKNSTF